jgi:hypothetical protein
MATGNGNARPSRTHQLLGMRFGRLTVVSFAGVRGKKRRWHCRCDCGNVTEVITAGLVSGTTASCGCLRAELARERYTENLCGQTFGKLVAIGLAPRPGKPGVFWRCRCSCGAESVVQASALKSGATRSCGCLHNELLSKANTRHGMSKTAIYNAWKTMVGRCHNSRHCSYYKYGARGIFVCSRWRRSFAAFFSDMGNRPRGRSIDRIDNDGGYCCGKCADCRGRGISACNCRWATDSEQQLNTRRSVKNRTA